MSRTGWAAAWRVGPGGAACYDRARLPRSTALHIEGSSPGSAPAAFGPFRVLHQVGAGTTGLVFRAHDPTEGRLVAIKAFRLDLTPERAAELAHALQALAARGLSHPSIAAPIAAGVEDDIAWFAQAYIPAESLDAALRQYGPPPVADALTIVTQLAGALDFAAAAGVIHGSLHPRDVLVAPGETHLVDLGVASALESCGVRAPVRRPYSAPERAAGRPLSREGDIFALAAMAFELLGGQPVTGAGDEAIVALPDLPGANREALLETFSFALALAPDERYASALAFAAPLKKALGDALTRPAPPRRRRAMRPPEELLPIAAADQQPIDEATEPSTETFAAGDVAEPTADTFRDVRHPEALSPADVPFRRDEPPSVDEPLFGAAPLDDTPHETSDHETPDDETPDDVTPDFTSRPGMHSSRGSREAGPREPTPPEEAPPGYLSGPTEPEPSAPAIEPIIPTGTAMPSLESPAYSSLDDGTVISPVERADVAQPAEPLLRWDAAEPERQVPAVGPRSDGHAPGEPGGVYLPPDDDEFADAEATADRPEPWREETTAAERRGWLPLAAMLLVGLVLGLAGGWLLFAGRGERSETRTGARTDSAAASPESRPRERTDDAVPPTETAAPRAAAPVESKPALQAPAARADERRAAVPAPARTDAAPRGRLVIRTRPAGARVEVDGASRGQSPLTLTGLSLGTHSVRVSERGYGTEQRRVALSSGSPSRTLDISLERTASPARAAPRPATFTGTLVVESRPAGAKVFVDGRGVGVTPLTLPTVSVGSHVVRLELRGHKRWSTPVRIVSGERERVAASLEEEPPP